MIKVGILVDSPFDLGGVRRVTNVFANELVKEGYDVSILIYRRNVTADYDLYKLDETVHLIWMNELFTLPNRIIRRTFYELKKIRNTTAAIGNSSTRQKAMFASDTDARIIAKYINANDFDYVIGMACDNSARLAIAKKYIKRARLIGWQHSTTEVYFKTKGIRMYNMDKVVSLMFENLDHYVVCTHDDDEKIKKYYGYDSEVFYDPNTFSTDKRSDLSEKNFIAAGRFVELKNYDKLIEAFAIFAGKKAEWKLVLVGEGPEKGKYDELVKKYGLENRIIMPGRSNDMESHYLNSSVCIMTSQWEGWGLTITEAMQYGLPVIAFDMPSVREIFGDADCGIIVPHGDVERLAQAMIKMTVDHDVLVKMGNNAVRQVKNFDCDVICRKWAEILK